RAHPNIYTFVDLLKKDEATSRVSLDGWMDVSGLESANCTSAFKKWNDKDESIKDLEERLLNGALNLDGFLQKMQRFCGI
ncbi:unnamed protein product, partial [Ixodes hexagonus]